MWPGCGSACASQTNVFEFTAHSDWFLPEFMSLTANVTFDDDATGYLVNYNVLDNSISARFSGWLDADGSVCGRPDWGGAIIGSNLGDTGSWWELDSDCHTVGPNDNTWCCQAKDRWVVSFTGVWDQAIFNNLEGNGGSHCNNQFLGGSTCNRVGYVAQFGDTNLVNDAMPVFERFEPVGPAPSASSPVGFGWYLWLDAGAPREFKITLLQVHHEARLIMAIGYPASASSFSVNMYANEFCNGGICQQAYESAPSKASLLTTAGTKQYYVETHADNTKTVFVRLYQNNDLNLGNPTWDDDYFTSLFTNPYLDSLPGRDWGIPFRKFHSYNNRGSIVISANCPGSGAYCQGGAQPVNIPAPLW